MKLHTEKCIASNVATHLSRHIGAKTEDAFLPNEKCTYNGYNIQMCRKCIIPYTFSIFNTFPEEWYNNYKMDRRDDTTPAPNLIQNKNASPKGCVFDILQRVLTSS